MAYPICSLLLTSHLAESSLMITGVGGVMITDRFFTELLTTEALSSGDEYILRYHDEKEGLSESVNLNVNHLEQHQFITVYSLGSVSFRTFTNLHHKNFIKALNGFKATYGTSVVVLKNSKVRDDTKI